MLKSEDKAYASDVAFLQKAFRQTLTLFHNHYVFRCFVDGGSTDSLEACLCGNAVAWALLQPCSNPAAGALSRPCRNHSAGALSYPCSNSAAGALSYPCSNPSARALSYPCSNPAAGALSQPCEIAALKCKPYLCTPKSANPWLY